MEIWQWKPFSRISPLKSIFKYSPLFFLLPLLGFAQENTFVGSLQEEKQDQYQQRDIIFKYLIEQRIKRKPKFMYGEPLGEQINYFHWEKEEDRQNFDSAVSSSYLAIPEVRASGPRQFNALKKYKKNAGKNLHHPFLPILKKTN